MAALTLKFERKRSVQIYSRTRVRLISAIQVFCKKYKQVRPTYDKILYDALGEYLERDRTK